MTDSTQAAISVDAAGWLVGDGVVRVPTVRHSPLDVPSALALIWHTMDMTGNVAASIAKRWAALNPGDRKASSTTILGRDGVLYALAPVTVGTWATAVPATLNNKPVDHDSYAVQIRGVTIRNINRATLSCEIENAGLVKKQADGAFYAYGDDAHPYAADPRYRVEHVRQVASRFYEDFTDAQIATAEALVRALAARFPEWGRAGFTLGHVDFDPDRKQDPWPAWRQVHLPAILDRVFGAA